MKLRQAVFRIGSEERALRLLEDFERMGLAPDSSTEDLVQRVADQKVPWNVRVALLMVAASAELEEVADLMPSLLQKLLERNLDFEELQVIESAWWMLGDFAKRVDFDELVGLANRTLENSARTKAANSESIVSAVAEAIVECVSEDGVSILPSEAERWLYAIDRGWSLALRSKTVITLEGMRIHRLATGREVKVSRRLLSDWLLKNVELDGPANGCQPLRPDPN